MKLLVISGAFPPMASGEAANTFHLCRKLAAAGVEVHLLTTEQPRVEQLDNVKLYPIMRRWSWREVGKLQRTLRDTAPDAILLIHLSGIYNNHAMVTFMPTLAKRVLPGVRFVTRFENPMFTSDEQPSLMSRALRKAAVLWAGADRCSYGFGTLLRDSDAVIALCEYHLERLRETDATMARKGVLIPPPANVSVRADHDGALRVRGRRALAASESDFVVGYLGYLYPIKGVETLLRSIASLVSQNLPVRLVILGGSPYVAGIDGGTVSYYQRMQQLAVDLGLSGLTTWAGSFSAVSDDIAASIHASDAFVLPFDNGIHLNNSSLATLASYGVPIVATREHTDSALVDQQNILLCVPRDPAALAEAIRKLMAHPELAARLRDGARVLARDFFDWDTALQHTLSALMPTTARELARLNRRETALTPASNASAGQPPQ